ncbi:MAG TPA: GNAT family N-acetyltransferase [Actinomycetota bacterium]|nr:GNAT family N-acetyltransferase [Actinomycetota bacterium]
MGHDGDDAPERLTGPRGDPSRRVPGGEVWHDDEEGEAELARLIVDPTRRRQGLGVALVRRLSAEAARAGFDDVWVRVAPENVAAIGCYRRAGFRRTSPEREEGFNQGQPRPYVWMRLEP